MKKRRVILLALLSFVGYQYYRSQPPSDIIERLEDIRLSFKDVYAKAGVNGDLVTIDTSYLSPETLEESDVEKVLSLMDRVAAYQTIGLCQPECFLSVVVSNFPWPRWIGPTQYYRYSQDGRFEEEVVDNLDEEVEKGIRYPTCEKTESDDWFRCKAPID